MIRLGDLRNESEKGDPRFHFVNVPIGKPKPSRAAGQSGELTGDNGVNC